MIKVQKSVKKFLTKRPSIIENRKSYLINRILRLFLMGECEFISKCPFFNGELSGNADSVDEMKEKYCKNNNLNCSRYMVANSIGKELMPPNLYPHEKTRAYLVIAENG